GTGSLRQAIAQANVSAASSDTITFAIPGGGVHSIRPLSALPAITKTVTIDGYSQPGSAVNTLNTGASNAVLVIELDGSQAGMADGLRFAPGSGAGVVSGLVINRFQGAGIYLAAGAGPLDSTWVRIWGNFIGTDPAGTLARGNGSGIVVDGGSSAIIGQYATDTAAPLAVNLISGNLGHGVYFATGNTGGAGSGDTVYNNLIGTDAAGTAALGNGLDGIAIENLPSQPFRLSTFKGNVIAANGGDGVRILGGRATLLDNLIGVGIGSRGANGPALGNAGDGVYVGEAAGAVTLNDQKYTSGFAAGHASIANNGGAGLYVDGNAQVDVVAQGFDHNGGLGIDIAPAGPNANDAGDADGGPNERLNAPVLDAVAYDPVTGYGDVAGHLDSNPGVEVEVALYHSDRCDPSGFGEGAVYGLRGSWPDDSRTLTTDPGGHTEFTLHSGSLQPGMAISYRTRRVTTAPGPAAIVVSEFSNCLVVPGGDVVFANGFEFD
ncbi:MAG TPA: right-handed parallel beta-helix repeat-containing protein, partial [Rhodanobacteraceae bacterium]|nr:right-handed parallel beta-helix repeat-containing protein [Rhodanobacteraceae bacterium]